MSDFDLRSGEAEAMNEVAIPCAGCDKVRYNPEPLVHLPDGSEYYSHWCEECLERRSRANLMPDPQNEDDWDFVQIRSNGSTVVRDNFDEPQCMCNNAEHLDNNYECPLNEERDICWGYDGPCDRYAVTIIEHPSDNGQVPMCSACVHRVNFYRRQRR